MLWQKQSKQPDALYIDISSGLNLSSEFSKMMSNASQSIKATKNHELALYYRKEGNLAFADDKWSFALECYNQSLLFAENGSEDISIAYANRSASFFYLQMYEKCLVDIQLAIDANYPTKLMPKLKKRKSECLKLSADERKSVDPKLSFEQESRFPCLANALQINYNKEFGRHFVAKCNIDVGQTVLVEEMYVMGQLRENTMKCSICFKEGVNLIPCKNCTNALFCSVDCQSNGIHEVECSTAILCEDQFDPTVFNVFRSVLVAINTFRNVDELMGFVEKSILQQEESKIAESTSDDKSKFQAFLQLKLSMDGNLKKCNGKNAISVVYKLLLQNSEINKMFQTTNRRRFLMHLIGHHLCIFECNRKAVCTFDTGKNYYLSIMASYLNHSCSPNVIFTNRNNFCVCKVIRPIQKGEQLFVHYFQHQTFKPFESCKTQLLKQFGFKCKCDQCACRQLSPTDRQIIKADELYQFLKNQNPFAVILRDTSHNTQNVEKICETFLQKYGRQIWSDEMCLVVGLYAGLHLDR